jgi:ABC-2 type transport system permease protein
VTDQVRILDQGYRRYEGERRGMGGSIRTVVLHSVQRALGLKRSFWQKVLPTLSIFIAFVPAIVFVGLIVLLPEELIEDPSDATYAGYYFFITAAMVLFGGLVGPETICTDRRTGMLGLYLASPLTRDTYLLAKGAGIATLLGIVTLGPTLLLLIGYALQGYGPDDPAGYVWLLVRMVTAAAVIALSYTSLALAVSSTTSRRAAASAGIILILFGSSIVANQLIDGANASDYLSLLDLLVLPLELVVRIYGEDVDRDSVLQALPTWAVVGAWVGWTTLFAGFARFRYQRLDVSR